MTHSGKYVLSRCSEVAAGAQIVYKLTWELGQGNGVVKVSADAELENRQVDVDRFQTGGQSRFTLNPEISRAQGN